jgi:hypothetical protein
VRRSAENGLGLRFAERLYEFYFALEPRPRIQRRPQACHFILDADEVLACLFDFCFTRNPERHGCLWAAEKDELYLAVVPAH